MYGYLAPHKVDPRLLDPKHVFMDINGETLQKPLAVLHPQAGKKRRHRDGYADNDTGLLAQPSMTASEFLRSEGPHPNPRGAFENSVRGRRDRESCADGSRGAGLWGRFTCIVEGRLPVFAEMERQITERRTR